MFYYLIQPILFYNVVLIAAAVVPAIALMLRVYRSDRIERESPYQLRRLAVAGVLASLIALVAERLLCLLLDVSVSAQSPLYNVLLYFGIVAFSEEGAKFFMLRRRSWRSPEFDCTFDGVVYAVFVSLGFAIWENVSYVLSYGLATAVVRAVTAIPGHACFGVFMGVFYSAAKRFSTDERVGVSRMMSVLAVLVPALIHGAYDYIASAETESFNWYFIAFIVALFALSFFLVGRTSKRDRYLDSSIIAEPKEWRD